MVQLLLELLTLMEMFSWLLRLTFIEINLRGGVEEFPGYEVDQNPEKFSLWPNSTYELINRDPEQSWKWFRCVSPYENHRGFDGLIQDIEKALADNWLAPSFQTFLQLFLIPWRISCILTARWNSPDNFQKWFQLLNREVLTQEQKDQQIEAIRNNYWLSTHDYTDTQVLEYYFRYITNYIPCHNPHVQQFLWLTDKKWSIRKTQAMFWWVQEVHRKLQEVAKRYWTSIHEVLNQDSPLAIWFSDDSISNIVDMWKFLQLSRSPHYKSRLYYTWNPDRYPHVNQELQWIWESRVISQYWNKMLQVRIS